MTQSTEELAVDLQRLHRAWEQLVDRPVPPRTTLQVVEFSLSTQQKGEVYATRLLRYLLDPTEPHGLDTAMLRQLLAALPTDVARGRDLTDVTVERQVPVTFEGEAPEAANPDRTGYADIVVACPDEWLVLLELKFGAAEGDGDDEEALTQTEFYADADTVGGRDVETSDCEYVYLYEGTESTEAEFDDYPWSSFVDEVLAVVLDDHGARLPQRTVTQLRAFRDDIRQITGMTETHEDELVELYREHATAIEDARAAFDDRWTAFTGTWGDRLARRLADTDAVQRAAESVDGTARVMVTREDDDETWLFTHGGRDWGHIYRHGWWQSTDDLTAITGRDTGTDVRVGFHHRLKANRRRAVEEETLTVGFRNMGSNDDAFTDAFVDRFEAARASFEEQLPDHATFTGNDHDIVRLDYQIPTADHDQFTDAYVAALAEAVSDLILTRPALIDQIEACYTAAVDDVYA